MYKLSANSVWKELLENLIHCGESVSPRDMQTLEIIGCDTKINMAFPVVTNKLRKINYSFLFGEAWWILSGSNRVRDIAPIMQNIAKFSDNGIMFNGAYGPKVIDQLGYVVDTLINDRSSRQALLTIWRENPRPSKDIPCTIALQFLIRGNKLHCVATMRSSDAWLGWVYDVFNFSMIAKYIVLFLRYKLPNDDLYSNLILGDLLLTAGSQHLYHKNRNAAAHMLSVDDTTKLHRFSFNDDMEIYSHPDELLSDLKAAAHGCPETVKSFSIRGVLKK